MHTLSPLTSNSFQRQFAQQTFHLNNEPCKMITNKCWNPPHFTEYCRRFKNKFNSKLSPNNATICSAHLGLHFTTRIFSADLQCSPTLADVLSPVSLLSIPVRLRRCKNHFIHYFFLELLPRYILWFSQFFVFVSLKTVLQSVDLQWNLIFLEK